MKRLSVFLFLLAAAILLAAQVKDGSDSLALLENKVWKAQLPESIQTAYETEFRGGQWISALLYQGKRYEMNRSYFLLGDTIVESDSGEKFKVRELTDSTLVFQYLPTQLIIGGGPVVFTTDNSAAGQRINEHRLDSIWRRELIWNLGVLDQSGKPMKDTSAIERPRWVNWGEDLERYCVSQMTYPEALLSGVCAAAVRARQSARAEKRTFFMMRMGLIDKNVRSISSSRRRSSGTPRGSAPRVWCRAAAGSSSPCRRCRRRSGRS